MTLNTPEVITLMALGAGCYLATVQLLRDALHRLPLDRVQVGSPPSPKPGTPGRSADDALMSDLAGAVKPVPDGITDAAARAWDIHQKRGEGE